MNRFNRILASTLVAVPLAAVSLVAGAQTANTPGGSAATGTPLDQSKPTGSMAPTGNTGTSPSATNPTGSLSKTAPATSGTMAPGSTMAPGGAMNSGKSAHTNSGKTGDKANTVAPGDAPTYPAPMKDGTPTK